MVWTPPPIRKPPAIIHINEFTVESATAFVDKFTHLYAENVLSVYVVINSDGGDPRAMYAMLDVINSWPYELAACGIGTCSSSAADLLFSIEGHERYAAPNTEFLIHGSTVLLQGAHGLGFFKRRRFEKSAKRRIDDKIISLIAQNCDIEYDYILEKMKENQGEWVLSSEEAVEIGFVDYIGVPFLDWG